MYCELFGLSALPFNNTPDPRFFFNTPDHEEALASLIYAAQERKGFVLVTGEVGSGKTLLSRILLGHLPAGARTAAITNTRLSGRELLLAICREFEVDVADDATQAQLCQALERFLLEQYSKDRLAVVILDEAQNLPMEAFEELRMLGNLEADDAKLLQVLILGQPELQQVFRQPDMRQLHQRVFRTFHLKALSRELAAAYISHRLAVVGVNDVSRIFDAEAIDAIYEHSQGVPRLINQICDNALLAAYGESSNRVTRKIINETVDQMLSLKVEPAALRSSTARSLLGAHAAAHSESAAPVRSPETERPYLELSSRLDSALQSFASLRSELHQTQEEGANARRLTTELHALRSEASVILDELRAAREGVGRQMQEVLSQARAQSERLDDRAARTLKENQITLAAMQEEARRLMQEMREYIERKESRIADLAADEQAGLQTARQIRSQAAAMLQQADASASQTRELVEQIRRQTDEDRQLFQQEKATLLGQFKELFDQVRTQSEAYAARNADLAEHQRAEFEQSRLQVQALGEQLRQRIIALDKRVTTVDEFIQQQATPLSDQRRQWREEIESALSEMQRVRHIVDSELREQRAERSSFAEESARLIDGVREQAASMLAGLRSNIGRSRDEMGDLWREAVREGEAAITAVRTRIDELRIAADSARKELEPVVNAIQSRLAEFTGDAGRLQAEVDQRVGKARTDLDDLTRRSRDALELRVKEIETQNRRKLDSFKTEADTFAQRLLDASNNAAQRAETLSRKLEDRLGVWQQQYIDCHGQYEKETSRMRADVESLTTRITSILKETESRFATATTSATESSARICSELQNAVAAADLQSRNIREASEGFTVSMIERLGQVAREARTVMGQTESTVLAIRDERESCLAQLRETFLQMTSRADGARIDLANLAEDLRLLSKGNVEQLLSTAVDARAGIVAILEQARRESTDSHARLGAVAAHVEKIAAGAETTSARLLNQVQASSTALLEHSNRVLAQSRENAELADQRVREVLAEAQSVQATAIETRDEIVATSSQTLSALQAASDSQRRAETLAQEILSSAEGARKQAEAALNMPRAIVEQAAKNANALSDLCMKTSKIVKHLATAESKAIREHKVLEAANDSALQNAELLREHTQRVAQLVGIIRQLYGAIDSKVDRIRQRLSSADELCRAVPKEIDALRDALNAPFASAARLAPTGTDAVAPMPVTTARRSMQSNRATADAGRVRAGNSGGPKVLPRPAEVEPIPFAKGSLGEIVQRNQQLNAWLKDMLTETDQPAATSPPNRSADGSPAANRADASAPIVKQ